MIWVSTKCPEEIPLFKASRRAVVAAMSAGCFGDSLSVVFIQLIGPHAPKRRWITCDPDALGYLEGAHSRLPSKANAIESSRPRRVCLGLAKHGASHNFAPSFILHLHHHFLGIIFFETLMLYLVHLLGYLHDIMKRYGLLRHPRQRGRFLFSMTYSIPCHTGHTQHAKGHLCAVYILPVVRGLWMRRRQPGSKNQDKAALHIDITCHDNVNGDGKVIPIPIFNGKLYPAQSSIIDIYWTSRRPAVSSRPSI